ncbi:uncharacterized protein [Diabrotica undecimpunctata]|uniref:uncharacterized protein n=1 Tax=Diabrotica undecimpunctata TaxID=50387 RepID=UPI003B63E73E
MTQFSSFSKEIDCLKNKDFVIGKGKLVPLNPFLDNNGILRVGVRLNQSSLSESQKHPILLPANHYITRLIIREEHVKLKHAGPQTTLYSVRQMYWPLDGRNVTRKILHRCIPCFRVKPRPANHKMGNLLEYRVTPSRPFLKTGVDYCGPLFIKEKKFRNRRRLKVYLAVYVCMSTRAVHLELVSDLTTEAFLASFRCFCARRVKCAKVYSDNATNFVGASRELYELFNSSDYQNAIRKNLSVERFAWHFIPTKSPHFEGIWEAAVKSFKNHLIRTVGDTLLTYKQLETYLIEIEAVLNSRPISPL